MARVPFPAASPWRSRQAPEPGPARPTLAVDARSPVDPLPGALATLLAATTADARPDVVAGARATRIPFRCLGGTSRTETWRTDGPVERSAEGPGGARVSEGADFQFGHLVLPLPSTGIEDVTEAAYREVLAAGMKSGYPHLLRVWNYFGGINEGDGDRER